MTENENPNSDDSHDDAPEIIVDSDWKEQVAKEKEAFADPAGASDGDSDKKSPDDNNASVTAADAKPNAEPEDIPPPPATFEILLSMMFTQAMSMLGQIPDPTGAPSTVNKPYAKHTIDTLEMLGEKTQGNLTEDESNMLKEALHALRMAYVNTK